MFQGKAHMIVRLPGRRVHVMLRCGTVTELHSAEVCG